MVLSAALLAAAIGYAEKKPMAFTGDGGLRAFQMDVTVNNRIRVTNCTKEWLSPKDYGQYAVVVIEGGLAKACKEIGALTVGVIFTRLKLSVFGNRIHIGRRHNDDPCSRRIGLKQFDSR